MQVFLWWLAIQALGWIALPVTFSLFRWLPDRGFSFSKILGLLLTSYTLWLGASLGILRNNLAGVLAAVLLLAALSVLANRFLLRRSGESILPFLRRHSRMILSSELLFAIALFFWAAVRAYASFKIQPSGGEKWMEIAFLNGTLNSLNFPPLDPWLSGYGISYYHFGYVMMAFFTRLTGALPEVAFDLYDALLFALTLLGAFGVVYNLVTGAGRTGQIRQGEGVRYGLLGAVLLGVMGNLEGLLESLRAKGWLSDAFVTWIDIPDLINAPVTGSFDPGGPGWFWWWRASRVIQDYDLAGQPLGISPITEFPFFSFLLGDNHPHKLALPFVLLSIALGMNLIRRQVACTAPVSQSLPRSWWNPVLTSLDGDYPLFLLTTLGIGALGFLNTWDMPVYIGLAVLAYAAGTWIARGRLDSDTLIRSGIFAAGLAAGAFVFYLFFYLSFSSQAGGILPYVYPPTRLPQYLVMFGPFVFILAWFLAAQWIAAARQEEKKPAMRPLLSAWGWVVTACVVLLALGLLMALLAAGGVAGLRAAFSDPVVQATLGGVSLDQAIRNALGSRLQNPWLFLALTVGLAFTAANLLKLAGPRQRQAVEVVEVNEPERAHIGVPVAPGGLGTIHGAGLPAPEPGGSEPGGSEPGGPEPGGSEPGDGFNNLVDPRSGEGTSAAQTFATPQSEPDSLAPGFDPLTIQSVFVLLMLLVGLALTFSVEFFYLRDNFGLRMNTVFKFYYQGWVLLALSSAYACWWLLHPGRAVLGRLGRAIFSTGAVLLIAAGMVYPLLGAWDRAGGFAGEPELNAAGEIARSNPDDWAVIEWLRENTSTEQGVPVILEAPAESYAYEGRISAFTGLPTVLGWSLHEGQWRGSYTEQSIREPQIAEIYTGSDPATTLQLLQQYEVRYVVLGNPEMNYISRRCQENGGACGPERTLRKFASILTPVFQQGSTTLYAVP